MVSIKSHWTDKELDASILTLCDDFPYARMAECSRVLEDCRRTTPHGTFASLVAAMRSKLLEPASKRPADERTPRPLEAHDPMTREQVYASAGRHSRSTGLAHAELRRAS